MKNYPNDSFSPWTITLALTCLCMLSACVQTLPLKELLSSQAGPEPTRSAPAPAPAAKPPAAVVSLPPVRPPTPVSVSSRANKGDNTTSNAMTYADFLKRLSTQKTSSFVGTSLQLVLKRGGDGGWDGFIQDVQSMVFFSCPPGSKFNGGPLQAKIAKIRDNDTGVFVQLDRCDK
jgi:hypothetical protein